MSGVESCGGGKWADIKKLGLRAIEKRSAVDLKDKWRNLQVSRSSPLTVTCLCSHRASFPHSDCTPLAAW